MQKASSKRQIVTELIGSPQTPTKTSLINVGGPINALSSNYDNSLVAVAGRTILKVYRYAIQDKFEEHIDLRSGRKQGLNLSIADLAWNHNNVNHLATAATNGHIIVWDLQLSSRDKQINLFKDHRRSVTKVCFHPLEAGLLISGSQDATMKMFDLRKKGNVVTFFSKSDGVRNVQFSPFEYFNFASSFDNGTVQIWDYRKPNACVFQFIAHKGSVYTLDWHPDSKYKQRLATGGRDNMIKIWDICDNDYEEVCNIQTNASVACVRWRTNRKDQIASVAMMLDHTINVWDTRRPFVPFAQFTNHEDSTTGIEWKKSDPDLLLSCSKDGTLYQHVMADASRPADDMNPHGLGFSCCGFVGQATSDYFANGYLGNEKKASRIPSRFFSKHLSSGSISVSQLVPKLEKDSSSSSLKRTSQMKRFLYPNFRLNVYKRNLLDNSSNRLDASLEKFKMAAVRYKLTSTSADMNKNFEKICEDNSQVAHDCHITYHAAIIWRLMGSFFNNESSNKTQFSSSSKVKTNVFKALPNKEDKMLVSKQDSKEHINGITGESNGDDSEQSHSDIALDDYLTDITKGNGTSEFECFYSEEEDTDDIGGQLEDMPTEAFQQRKFFQTEETNNFASGMESPFGNDEARNAKPSSVFIENIKMQENDRRRRKNSRRHISTSASIGNLVTSPSPPSEADDDDITPTITLKPLNIPYLSFDAKLDTICKTLEQLAENGEIQTAVCCLLVLTNKLNYCPIDEGLAEVWQLSYLGLLSQLKLWNQYTEVINLSTLPNIRNLNSSCIINTSCGFCHQRLQQPTPWKCEKHADIDHRNADVDKGVRCSYCERIVKDLYTWCRVCFHGGHLNCLKSWFSFPESNQECPTGCGHKCSLT